MLAFVLLIVLVTEAAVVPTDSSDSLVYASSVITTQVSEHREISLDNPNDDRAIRRDGVRRNANVQRISTARKFTHHDPERRTPGWKPSKHGHIMQTEEHTEAAHYNFAVSEGDERQFTNHPLSTERELPPDRNFQTSRGHFPSSLQQQPPIRFKQAKAQSRRDDYREMLQDSLHLHKGGGVVDRQTVKNEGVESDTSESAHSTTGCKGCDLTRRDTPMTTHVTHSRSSIVETTKTTFVDRMKPESKSTTLTPIDRNDEKEATISDGIKVYFGGEDERRTATVNSNQASKPNPEDDGKIYFEPELHRKTTTPPDREHIMKIGQSVNNGALSTTSEVETVTLDNRNAFDVNVTCGPGMAKISGGQCVPTD